MSIKTWKEEFYPVKPRKSMTTKEAIEHSLRKWEGLRKSNLNKHGLIRGFWGDAILEGGDEFERMTIGSDSCALCKKFYSSSEIEADEDDGNFIVVDKCSKCPLAHVLGEPCDGRGDQSVYGKWVDSGNPVPMIAALKKALRKEEKNES